MMVICVIKNQFLFKKKARNVSGDRLGFGQLKYASMMILAVIQHTTTYFLLQEAEIFVGRQLQQSIDFRALV